MNTQAEVRAAFWSWLYDADRPLWRRRRPGRPQNGQPADIRMAFVDWVDAQHRSGLISDALAEKVTL